jgi:hypothetical protein
MTTDLTSIRRACAAGPPSPPKAESPVPATVEIVDVVAFTSRTTNAAASATHTLPAASTAIPPMPAKRAAVAAPPSPE